MTDSMFILAMAAAHLTGTLNGVVLGLWIGERVNQFMRQRERS